MQLLSYPFRRPPLGVEFRGSVYVVLSERPAIPLGDSVTSDVPEDSRPIDPERRRQLFHRDVLAVGGDQLGNLIGSEAPLDWETANERVRRMDRHLTETLS